jgi:hypothetical protein
MHVCLHFLRLVSFTCFGGGRLGARLAQRLRRFAYFILRGITYFCQSQNAFTQTFESTTADAAAADVDASDADVADDGTC